MCDFVYSTYVYVGDMKMHPGECKDIVIPKPTSQLSRYSYMFDVDCSSLDLRNKGSFVTGNNHHDQHVVPVSEPIPQNRNHGVVSSNPGIYGQHPRSATGVYDTNSHRPKQDVQVDIDNKLNSSSKLARYEQQSVSTSRIWSLFNRETVASLYILSLLSGVSVLGIVGGAHNQDRVFLSFSIFYGIFIPVVSMHICLVLDTVECVVFGLLFLITAPVSVPLSLLHRSHVFASMSLILVSVFHLTAARQGFTRIFLFGILTLFIWMCFGGVLDHPLRGDVTALIVVPGTQIVYVCFSGFISVLSKGARVV
jgi:hypothetical protein